MSDEIEAGDSREKSVEGLITALSGLRLSFVNQEIEFRDHILKAHPAFRKSAVNLVHYLALRRQDVRSLQDQLATFGLSSLGRSEAHVMFTLEAVIDALLHMAGRCREKTEQLSFPGFQEGSSLLKAHTDALLGEAPAHRSVRVMVTMSTEMADDYVLVRTLLAQGMNCMRINCAHDSPDIWERMINHLKRARHELGLPCRILMDLAGPKLRTCSIEPGPQVVVWHPRRDAVGHVTNPARIWLAPTNATGMAPPEADAILPVNADWLSLVKPGERIHFKDARGKRRALEVIGNSGHGRWARCDQTAYVTPDTVLLRVDVAGESGREGRVGPLPALERGILLHKGEYLVLARDQSIGRHALVDDDGRVLEPATIACTLPEVLSQIRPGERVWFDDGKIGGVAKEVEADGVRVEINHAKPNGDRLLADKGINLPDTRISLPALTDKDEEDLKFIARHADVVGMSFIRHERDVRQIRDRLDRLEAPDIGLILKIETRQAFERLPNLIFAAIRRHPVGVMIARGDLAVECGYERMAEVQEEILWVCEAAHLPVIWATQVLESLTKKGLPSRAEITDAAMGERAECVMLNKGPHVVAAVGALDDILRRMQDHQAKKSSRLRPLYLSEIHADDDL